MASWKKISPAKPGSTPGAYRRSARLACPPSGASYSSPCGRFIARPDGTGWWALKEEKKMVYCASTLKEIKEYYAKKFAN